MATAFECVLTWFISLDSIINALQKIEGLDALVNLEELWLGKNKITRLEVCSTHAGYLDTMLWAATVAKAAAGNAMQCKAGLNYYDRATWTISILPCGSSVPCRRRTHWSSF